MRDRDGAASFQSTGEVPAAKLDMLLQSAKERLAPLGRVSRARAPSCYHHPPLGPFNLGLQPISSPVAISPPRAERQRSMIQ